MMQFSEYYNGAKATVVLNHALFGIQEITVDNLHIINDADRIGVRLHGQDIYMKKDNIKDYKVYERAVVFSDDRLAISIYVNKL